MYEQIVVIVPVYNEEQTIGKVIKALQEVGFPNILVIDDGSKDNTYKCSRDKNVVVLRHAINLGKGAALKTGFRYGIDTGFKYIVTCDGDGQHEAADVQKIASLLIKEKHKVVLGSRFKNQDRESIPPSRYLYNKIANGLNFILHGIIVSDSQCGLRGYSIDVIKKMDLKARNLDIESEILGELKRLKVPILETSVKAVYTEYSLSKGQSFVKGVQTLWQLVVSKL